MHPRLIFAASVVLMVASSASAVELRHTKVRNGLAGLDAAPVTVANASAHGIVCVAELAHWYSAEVARAPAGAAARIDLWRDPTSGAYVALNGIEDNMPVERLWCGFAGRTYETRIEIVLDRGRPTGPSPLSLTCTGKDERLVCR